MNPNFIIMSIRRLLTMFIAVAVLFAPALTGVGEAHAAVPDQVQIMEVGHCSSPSSKDDQAPAKNCCVAMCTAVAMAPPAADGAQVLARSAALPRLSAFRVGLPAEIATPPPRGA